MVGQTLAHFRIDSKLGEGGMGAVYKAHDTQLDRTVAIKVLLNQALGTDDRRQRFIREARTASGLNHPNIVTIHAVETGTDPNYIVMEFVDGKPLNELIPPKGLKLNEGLRIAIQIASALTAAHAARIVHRDLKPANVILTKNNTVKVLDFGLAKPLAHTESSSDDDATMTDMQTPTVEGMILGSVPYMSPEQAQGLPVDERSDIFSFGAVLYEIFSGHRPFRGKTTVETLAQIVQSDPPTLEGLPADLERIISRCLRKDLNRRSQNITDVKLALEEMLDESESGRLSVQTLPATAAPSPPAPSRNWLWPAIAAACVMITAATVIWSVTHRAPATTAPLPLTRITPDDGYSYDQPSISQDGKLLASISDRGGSKQVWLQQIGGGDPLQITHYDKPVLAASFFPDGTRLLVQVDGGANDRSSLEVLPTLGGQSRVLFTGHVHYPSISPDGSKIAYYDEDQSGFRVWFLPSDGGTPKQLEKYAPWSNRLVSPTVSWLSDSRGLLFLAPLATKVNNLDNWDWFYLPIDGSDVAPTGAGPKIRAAGLGLSVPLSHKDKLLFSTAGANSNVWQIDFSLASKKAGDNIHQLTFGTNRETPGGSSANGILAISSSISAADFYVIPTDPATGQPTSAARRLTQDGRQKSLYMVGGDPGALYFYIPDVTANRFVFPFFSLDLTSARQNLVHPGMELSSASTISPDGKQLAYTLPEGDLFTIHLRDVANPADPGRVLCKQCGRALRFSPDNRYLFIWPSERVKPDPKQKRTIALLEISTGKITPWLEDPVESVNMNSQFNQDWLAILTIPVGATKTSHNYLVPWRPTPIPKEEWTEFTIPPNARIAPMGLFIYFFKDSEFAAMRFDSAKRRFSEPFPVKIPAGPGPQLSSKDIWSIRGPGIAFSHRTNQSSVWMLKLPE